MLQSILLPHYIMHMLSNSICYTVLHYWWMFLLLWPWGQELCLDDLWGSCYYHSTQHIGDVINISWKNQCKMVDKGADTFFFINNLQETHLEILANVSCLPNSHSSFLFGYQNPAFVVAMYPMAWFLIDLSQSWHPPSSFPVIHMGWAWWVTEGGCWRFRERSSCLTVTFFPFLPAVFTVL